MNFSYDQDLKIKEELSKCKFSNEKEHGTELPY